MEKKVSSLTLTFVIILLNVQESNAVFNSSKIEGEDIAIIQESNFAKKRISSPLFSYSTRLSGANSFNQEDFNEWKQACASAANSWIYTKKSDKNNIEEYEKCRNLTSELTLALVVIESNKNDINKIRKTLEPVVQAAKRLKSSFLKKVKGSLSKETPATNVINTIKQILNKRVKEVIDDFNDRIKSSGETNIKKLSI